MKRRDFLKMGIIVASTPIFGNLLRLLPSPSIETAAIGDGNSPLCLFVSELSRFPKGHVAHSIGMLEMITDQCDFDDLIRGMSFSADRRHRSYFAFSVYDSTKWAIDTIAVRKCAEDMTSQIQNYWRHKRIFWGIAPQLIAA